MIIEDKQIIALLRSNSNMSTAEMARTLNISFSGMAYRLKKLSEKGIVKRYTALLDYNQAGFSNVMNLIIKVRTQEKHKVIDYLVTRNNVNTLSVADSGNIFVINTVDKEMRDYFNFKEELESKFDIEVIHESWIVTDIKKEEFLSQYNISS